MSLRSGLLTLTAIACSSAAARADVIPLTNPGFELDLPGLPNNGGFRVSATGWLSSGDAGVFNPGPASFPLIAPLEAPQGSLVGYLGEGSTALSQETAAAFAVGATYRFDVLIGNRQEIGSANYQMEILADGVPVASARNPVVPPRGGFAAASLLFVAGGNVEGRRVGIRVVGFEQQTNLDDVRLSVVVCYADCDTNTGRGVLDIFDFLCFQNAFAAGDPYACNCDTGSGPGACDIFDFLCFQNAFDAGCS